MDLQSASRERHERFVRRVAESGEVWGLRNDEGWCVSPSSEDHEDLEDEDLNVIPFWSEQAYASQCAQEEWADYEPTPIPLELFLEEWLPGMAEDGLLVGTNWNPDLIGREIEPLDLKEEIERSLGEGS